MKDCPAVSDLDRAEAANDITNIEEEDVSLLTVDQIVSISNDERLKVLANTALDRREAVAHGDELEPLPPKRLKSKASAARLNVAESFSLDNPPPSGEGRVVLRSRGSRSQPQSRGRGHTRGSALNTLSARSRPVNERGEYFPHLFPYLFLIRSRIVLTSFSLEPGERPSSANASSRNANFPYGDENGSLPTSSSTQFASYPNGNGSGAHPAATYPETLDGNFSNGQDQMIDPSLQNQITQQLVSPGFHSQPGQIEHPAWTAPDYYPNGDEYENEPAPEEFMHEIPEPVYEQNLYPPDYPMANGPSPPTNFSAETGDGKRTRNQRLRGKFGDRRKEEVRQMRTLGACVRCRMLKKPCTPGETCEACMNISDPRVWTFKCTRERIDTSFFHFKCGIYSILAYAKAITPLKEVSPIAQSEMVIDVTQFPQSGVFMSFNARHGVPIAPESAAQTSSAAPAIPVSQYDGDGLEVLVRSIEREGLASAITADSSGTTNPAENSLTFDTSDFVGADAGNEPVSNNPPINEAVSGEVKLLEHESQDIPTKMIDYMRRIHGDIVSAEQSPFFREVLAQAQTLAATYIHHPQNHPSNISGSAIEMYAMVQILLGENLTWYITERSRDAAPGTGRSIPPGTKSYELIEKQLKAAAEKNAGLLVEGVVASLDRMLLRTYSRQRFDLFIVGLIILDVLEKATWEFCKWQGKHASEWPLSDKTPADFVDKRRSIAELLSNLLRVRDVPAQTKANERGILTTQRGGEFGNFYRQVSLSEQRVDEAFNMDITTAFQPDNSQCFQLSLCAWLLLPLERLPKLDRPPVPNSGPAHLKSQSQSPPP